MTILRPRVMAVRAYCHAALVCAPARPNRGPGPRRFRRPLAPERLRDERGEGEEELAGHHARDEAPRHANRRGLRARGHIVRRCRKRGDRVVNRRRRPCPPFDGCSATVPTAAFSSKPSRAHAGATSGEPCRARAQARRQPGCQKLDALGPRRRRAPSIPPDPRRRKSPAISHRPFAHDASMSSSACHDGAGEHALSSGPLRFVVIQRTQEDVNEFPGRSRVLVCC